MQSWAKCVLPCAIAKSIIKASEANGGILSQQDFARYAIEELKPIHCHYRGYSIISAPPPSSGGVTLCEMLHVLENFPLRTLGYHTAASINDIVETMRYAYADRNNKLGDPNFVKNPIDTLLSASYTKSISQRISESRYPKRIENTTPLPEKTDTTHYSVYDSKGNAVAVTYTLNGFFGAKVIADHTGFFLNNEMDDFATKIGAPNKFGLVQFEPNAIQAGKRPLSSMTPTIVLKDNHVQLVLGSPGGPRIISAVLLAILNVIDYGLPIQDAVNAPRIHYQGQPDTVFAEPKAFSYFATKQLEHLGYSITWQPAWAAVEAIAIDPNDHHIDGANDNRRPDGAAIGY